MSATNFKAGESKKRGAKALGILLTAALVFGGCSSTPPVDKAATEKAAAEKAAADKAAADKAAEEKAAAEKAAAETAPAEKAETKKAEPAESPSKASLLNPATLNARAPEAYKARLSTTKGDILVEVTRAWAPLGADRFYNLIRNGFYNNASFFRVLPGFVVQFGIPASPQIARVWDNAAIKDDAVKQSNLRGTLTFATAGPNTRTTQIFINLADNKPLDPQGFSPFGRVVEGMDVVEKLYSGYGEGAPGGRGPDQSRIQAQGKAYLDKNFPNLDSIKTAEIK
jgi:peptidyl-prolyl cis-trans isomerase A (cyclophilin A)